MRKKQINIDSALNLVDGINVFDKKLAIAQKGCWQSLFESKNPLVLEIGMGDGAFLGQMVSYYQDSEISKNYLGLEMKPDRIFKSFKKNKELIGAGLLKLIISNANYLAEFFEKNEVSEIYLNFSDPWPKDRHEKNRLTHPNFLKLYKKVLKRNGKLFIKTDNLNLYNYSLKSLKKSSFKIISNSLNLHKSDFILKNFLTEFEQKYISKGLPIYYLEAVNKKLI